ncbi:MAG: hypothetical protein M3Y82_15450 [Verrucomicrobiota bacterium]|nr:hypothetical protein [Verrucomicrobiota bacterium]
MSVSSEKIIELRQRLAEQFPNLRIVSEASLATERACGPTGLAQVDELLQGGLPKGAITELVTEKNSSGSALFISSLLNYAAQNNQILALIDGQDSFDPAFFSDETLARLLWVRCKSAAQALKAADLILRDRNLPLVLLDLQLAPTNQLRKISSSIWFRLQRIVEVSSTIFLVISPQPIVGSAQVRLNLHARFELDALEKSTAALLGKLKFEIAHHRLHVSRDERVAEAG